MAGHEDFGQVSMMRGGKVKMETVRFIGSNWIR